LERIAATDNRMLTPKKRTMMQNPKLWKKTKWPTDENGIVWSMQFLSVAKGEMIE